MSELIYTLSVLNGNDAIDSGKSVCETTYTTYSGLDSSSQESLRSNSSTD